MTDRFHIDAATVRDLPCIMALERRGFARELVDLASGAAVVLHSCSMAEHDQSCELRFSANGSAADRRSSASSRRDRSPYRDS